MSRGPTRREEGLDMRSPYGEGQLGSSLPRLSLVGRHWVLEVYKVVGKVVKHGYPIMTTGWYT